MSDTPRTDSAATDAGEIQIVPAHFARQLERELNAAILQGHSELCYYCQKPINSLAGNPNEWGVPLCHTDDPGVMKWHHVGCIQEHLAE